MTSFYDEYEFLMRRLKVPLYAKTTTFSTAFKLVKLAKAKQNIFVRLSNAKGKLMIYFSVYIYNFRCSLSSASIVLLYYLVRIV